MSKAKNIKKQPPRRASKADVAFADMGLANPELELAKSKLVMEIGRVIEERGLSQVQAGRIIGLAQPKLSQLLNGHWKSYSVDRLTRYLNKLGVTVRVSLERNRATWKEGRFIVAER